MAPSPRLLTGADRRCQDQRNAAGRQAGRQMAGTARQRLGMTTTSGRPRSYRSDFLLLCLAVPPCGHEILLGRCDWAHASWPGNPPMMIPDNLCGSSAHVLFELDKTTCGETPSQLVSRSANRLPCSSQFLPLLMMIMPRQGVKCLGQHVIPLRIPQLWHRW